MAVKSPGLASDSGIYNSSEEPTYWNTYKFCNVLYVNAAHYEHPPQTNTAIVSVVMRHHKVRFALRASIVTAHAGQPREAGVHVQPA